MGSRRNVHRAGVGNSWARVAADVALVAAPGEEGGIKTRIKITSRDLGRQGVVGYAFHKDKRALIDPHQGPFGYLDTLIHELLHCMAPEWSEKRVGKAANEIATHVWRARYRRIEK